VAALLLVLFAAAAVRWRLLDVPLERDEGEYGYMAQLINQGVPPYVAAYNMKLPGTYGIYAVFLRLFGDDAKAIRIGLLITNAASIVLLYLLARPRTGDAGGIAAAAAFATWTLSPTVLGTFAHATNFVVVFALAGLVVLDRARKGWVYVAAGVLLGLSILMKQNGIFFAAFAAGWIVWREWPAHRKALARVGLLALGAALPLALTAFVLWRAGAWSRFWFWVVEYASAYVSQVGPREAWYNLVFTGRPLVKSAWILWLLAMGGLALAVRDTVKARRSGFLLVFAAVSAVAVCPGFWFRPHYFVLLLPAAALLAARTIQGAIHAAEGSKRGRSRRSLSRCSRWASRSPSTTTATSSSTQGPPRRAGWSTTPAPSRSRRKSRPTSATARRQTTGSR
jgi:4-amino-4-deoxy-L-arabinose transferase-like glycosyltransferase